MTQFDLNELVGKSEEEATILAESKGYTVRIMFKNGEPYIGTCDVRLDRINFHIEDDFVVKYYIG